MQDFRNDISLEVISKLKQDINNVLVGQYVPEPGKRVMCCTFPSRGLYVTAGFVKHALGVNGNREKIKEYLYNMRFGDYLSMEATMDDLENRSRYLSSYYSPFPMIASVQHF